MSLIQELKRIPKEIPVYRAEIDESKGTFNPPKHEDLQRNGVLIKENDKWYVIGTLTQESIRKRKFRINPLNGAVSYQIINDTLSIHHQNMNDSNINPIFASLREDGKGGDICNLVDCDGVEYVYIYNNNTFTFGYKNINPTGNQWEYCDSSEVESRSESEIIGVQK